MSTVPLWWVSKVAINSFFYICSDLYTVHVAALPVKRQYLLSQTLNLAGVVTCLHSASGTVLAPSLDLTDFYASAVPLRTLLPLWGQLQVNILNNGKLISR